jgi:hypothetical protein
MIDLKIFKQVKDTLFLDVPYAEVYLLNDYFDNKIASIEGNSVITLGLFSFGTFPNDLAKESDRVLRQLILPTSVQISFSRMYRAEKQLKKELEPESYTVLCLEKGDVFLNDINCIINTENAMKFINLLHGGKLPKDIPYDKILATYQEALSLNGASIDVPSLVLEFIISELYRSKVSFDRPFRMDAGKGKSSMYEYKATSIKNLPSFNSTFTALSFEDINQSIVSSVERTRTGSDENISPVEKTIKY